MENKDIEHIDNILNFDLDLNKIDNYIITKNGANKILNYINKNNIDELDLFKLFIKNKDLKICKNNNYLINFDNNVIKNSIKLKCEGDYFDFNLYNFEDEYIFKKGDDHIGDDICFKNNITIYFSLLFCEFLNECVSFNSYGYFKHKTDINNLKNINYPDQNGGIYINIKKHNDIYNPKTDEKIDNSTNNDANTYIIEDIMDDVSEDVSNDVSEDVSNDVSEDVLEDISENVSEDVSEDVSNDVSEDVYNTLSNNLNKKISKNILSNSLEKVKTISNKNFIEEKVNSNNIVEYNYEIIDKKTDIIQFIGDYVFIENYDYSDNNLCCHSLLNLNELFKIANLLDECVAFNTNGYFKNKIDLLNLDYTEDIDSIKNKKVKNNGIYIKIKELKNNKYLKLKNINTIDKEYSINKTFDFDVYSNFVDNNNESIAFTNLGFIKNEINLDKIINIEKIYNNSLYINIIKYYERLINNKKYTNIKILCDWTSSENLCNEMNKMSKGKLLWNNINFVINDNLIDYYLILNKPYDNDFYIVEKTIILRTKTFKKYQIDYFNFIKNIKYVEKNNFLYEEIDEKSINMFIWNNDLTYGYLKNNINIVKNNSNKICTIFNFQHLEMEKFEAGLLKYIELKYHEFIIDIYSNNNKYSLKNVIIENNNGNSNTLIQKYKYCIVIEDFIENNFFEKIYNCILNETLCFYIGPHNISNYFDSNSYVLLDRSNFENCYQIIKKGIDNNLWEEKIDSIRKDKIKILEYYNIFPTIERIIKDIK
jgi:hypothetical protein